MKIKYCCLTIIIINLTLFSLVLLNSLTPPPSPISLISPNKEFNKSNVERVFKRENCIYDLESIKEMNIHVIPHSHQDTEWLNTFEEYYEGNNSLGKCVKCIYNNLLSYFKKDNSNKKTFVISEISFFEKWYSSLTIEDKDFIKALVKEEKIEFVNGGYCLNDEATPDYNDIILQKRIGLEFLYKEFNIESVDTAWNIDQFGHSATEAYLETLLEQKYSVMSRVDYVEKQNRILNNKLEFNWKPYYHNDINNKIFVHITSNHYTPNRNEFGSYLDTSNGEYSDVHRNNKLYMGYLNEIQKEVYEKSLINKDYEHEEEILSLKEYIYERTRQDLRRDMNRIYQYFESISLGYKTKEVLFLYGDDFSFQNPEISFSNMDLIIKEFDENPCFGKKVKVFYSTPKKYFDTVKKEYMADTSKMDYISKINKDNRSNETTEILLENDFFPYRDYQNHYWTGYYSSRPALKGLIKEASYYLNELHTLKSLFAITRSKNLIIKLPSLNKMIGILKRVLAKSQHHDSISGTSREAVSNVTSIKLEKLIGISKKLISISYLYDYNTNNNENLNILEEKQEDTLIKNIDSILCHSNKVFDENCNNIIVGVAEDASNTLTYITYINNNENKEEIKQVKIKIDVDVVIENISEYIIEEDTNTRTTSTNSNTNTKKDDIVTKPMKYSKACYDVVSYCEVILNIIFTTNKNAVVLVIKQKLNIANSKKNNNTSKTVLDIENNISSNISLFDYRFDNDIKVIKQVNYENFNEILLSNSNYTVSYNKSSNKIMIINNNNDIGDTLKNSNNKIIELSIFHAYYSYDSTFERENTEGAYLFGTNYNVTTYKNYTITKIDVLKEDSFSLISLFFENSILKINISLNKSISEFPSINIETVLFPFKSYYIETARENMLIVQSNLNNEELTSMFENHSDNNKKTVFYTDSNGIKAIKRVKNHRFTFDNYKAEKQIESNFYPSTKFVFITENMQSNKNKDYKDKDKKETNNHSLLKLSIITDRSQSVSSLNKGEIQIILNRYSQVDDNKGLSTGIKESLSDDSYGFEIKHDIIISYINNTKEEIEEKELMFSNNKKFRDIWSFNFNNNLKAQQIRTILNNSNSIVSLKSKLSNIIKDCFEYYIYDNNSKDNNNDNKSIYSIEDTFIQFLQIKSSIQCDINAVVDNIKKIFNVELIEYKLSGLKKSNSVNKFENVSNIEGVVSFLKRTNDYFGIKLYKFEEIS